MAQITRQKNAEIENGNIIDANDLDAEFDTLYAAHNANDTVLDNIANNAFTFAGVKTFSATPKMNAIDERTGGSGVTIDSVLCKDGMVTVAGTAAAAGQIGYSSNLLKYHNGTSELTIATLGDIVTAAGYRNGPHPYWASVATVVVPSGYSCNDDGDVETITVGSDLTVNLGSSGALGLDTGTEASDTPYYIWLCSGGSGTTAIFSASKTTPTLPSGYNTYKRRLPGAWHNDSSSNLIKGDFFGDLNYPTFIYNVTFDGITASPTTLVSGSSSHPTTFTDLSVPYIPADSEMVYLYAHSYTAGNDTHIRADGESHDGYVLRGIGSNPVTGDVWIKAPSQTLEWKTDNAANSIGIHVQGYAVTEAC